MFHPTGINSCNEGSLSATLTQGFKKCLRLFQDYRPLQSVDHWHVTLFSQHSGA